MSPITEMDKAVTSLQNASTTTSRKKWYSIALDLWNQFPELQRIWNHVANAYRYAMRFVRKVFTFAGRASKYDEYITLCVPVKRKVECAYGLHILDHETGEIIASKIGTTKDIATRMRDEIIGYTKSYGKQVGIRVVRFVEYNSHAEITQRGNQIATALFFPFLCEKWNIDEVFQKQPYVGTIDHKGYPIAPGKRSFGMSRGVTYKANCNRCQECTDHQ